MTVQNSVAVRNARLDAWETTIGASPLLQLFSGAQPANCAAADSGTKLAEITLPSNWMADAGSASKVLAGVWADVGIAAGTVAHYRIKDSTGTTCHEQGSVSTTLAGTGDMQLDNTNITIGQAVEISAFTRNAGNA